MVTLQAVDLALERRLAEAAGWRTRLATLDLESTPEFEAWLAEDPQNADAWDQAETAWNEVGAVATAPELMAVRRRAMDLAERQGRRNRRLALPRARFASAIAAALILVVGAGGVVWMLNRSNVYETGLGERRVIPLPDGSTISLDSQSRVVVDFSRDSRKVTLVRGQARFDVAHNVLRPFSVTARDETVVATGTAFNVDLLGPQTLVTLIEGHVVVLEGRSTKALVAPGPGGGQPAAIALDPGQQLTAQAAAPATITHVSIEQATAWQTGRLVFDDAPLGVVAARVSRYADHAITVDPAVAGLRISGVFNAGDVAGFVESITQYLPVRALSRPNGETELAPRSEAS